MTWSIQDQSVILQKGKWGGALHSTKISRNFGLKLNGSARSNGKSFEKNWSIFEVDISRLAQLCSQGFSLRRQEIFKPQPRNFSALCLFRSLPRGVMVHLEGRLRAVSLFLENCGEKAKQGWKRARATSGSWHHHSHVTLTVTLARLLVLRSSPRIFEEKKDCSQFTWRGA